jgi:hypothetical protein
MNTRPDPKTVRISKASHRLLLDQSAKFKLPCSTVIDAALAALEKLPERRRIDLLALAQMASPWQARRRRSPR